MLVFQVWIALLSLQPSTNNVPALPCFSFYENAFSILPSDVCLMVILFNPYYVQNGCVCVCLGSECESVNQESLLIDHLFSLVPIMLICRGFSTHVILMSIS